MEIFENGIKGIKKITGKYKTSKPLKEVKKRCLSGIRWEWRNQPARSGKN
jgi:hypothetical protein